MVKRSMEEGGGYVFESKAELQEAILEVQAKSWKRDHYGNVRKWDISKLTDLSHLFDDLRMQSCGKEWFAEYMNDWDVSNVTTFESCFENCDEIEVLRLFNWDMRNATNTNRMFKGCSSLVELDIRGWQMPKLKNCESMFANCYVLESKLYIGNWNCQDVDNASMMFSNCVKLNSPWNGWNMMCARNLSNMFQNCYFMNRPFDTAWVFSQKNVDLTGMFRHCCRFNQPLDHWDVSNVMIFTGMFMNCHLFNQSLGSWNVSNGDYFTRMFADSGFNGNVENWDVSNGVDFSGIFANAKKFNQPLTNWKFSSNNTFSMRCAFKGAVAFNQPLNQWNMENCCNMFGMFMDTEMFDQPLNEWNVNECFNFACMFMGSKKFNSAMFTIRWNPQKKNRTVRYMFFQSSYNQSMKKVFGAGLYGTLDNCCSHCWGEKYKSWIREDIYDYENRKPTRDPYSFLGHEWDTWRIKLHLMEHEVFGHCLKWCTILHQENRDVYYSVLQHPGLDEIEEMVGGATNSKFRNAVQQLL